MPTSSEEFWAKSRYFVSKMRYWADYFFPREVLGPFLIVFAFENVTEILFAEYYAGSELIGWLVIGTGVVIITSFWGIVDEDKEEVKEKLEDREHEIEEETGVDVGPKGTSNRNE